MEKITINWRKLNKVKLSTASILGFILLATFILIASNNGRKENGLVTPTPTPIVSSQVETLKAVYDTDGYMKPRRFQVKVGTKVRLEVLAKIDGEGCMGSIMVPDFSEEIYGFEQGKTVAFEFTAQNPGEFWITCAMGVPHGVIEVL